MIDDRRQKAQLARRRRDVQDLMTTLEVVLKDVERVASKFNADVPEIEYEIKSQLELCKVRRLSPDLRRSICQSESILKETLCEHNLLTQHDLLLFSESLFCA